MTVIAKLMERTSLSIENLCRAAKIHTTDAYRVRKGVQSVGPRVRPRIAAALRVREEELFDSDGWPLAAEA